MIDRLKIHQYGPIKDFTYGDSSFFGEFLKFFINLIIKG